MKRKVSLVSVIVLRISSVLLSRFVFDSETFVEANADCSSRVANLLLHARRARLFTGAALLGRGLIVEKRCESIVCIIRFERPFESR